jgi:hypothetical protein
MREVGGSHRGAWLCLLIVWAVLFGATRAAEAAQPDETAVLAQQLKVMQARIQYLESRVDKLEQENLQAAAAHSKNGRSRNTNATASGTTQQSGQVLASAEPTGAAAEETGTAEGGNAAQGQTTTQAQNGAKTSAQVLQESIVPQETFLFRDQSPTLPAGQFEAAQDFSYLHSSGFLQTDRVYTGSLGLRYGVKRGLELGISVPYYYSDRTTTLLPGEEEDEFEHGVGGAIADVSYALVNDGPGHPGISITATGGYPGTVSPYDFANYSYGANPVKSLQSVQGSGHWSVGGNLLAYKIVDPLILFAGVGMQYYIPRDFSGYTVEPAIRYIGNAGVSFAVSETTTLGFAIAGFYQSDLEVDGHDVPESYQEQYVAQLALTQQLKDNVWLEPTIGVGLTDESPDLSLGVGLRERW